MKCPVCSKDFKSSIHKDHFVFFNSEIIVKNFNFYWNSRVISVDEDTYIYTVSLKSDIKQFNINISFKSDSSFHLKMKNLIENESDFMQYKKLAIKLQNYAIFI